MWLDWDRTVTGIAGVTGRGGRRPYWCTVESNRVVFALRPVSRQMAGVFESPRGG